MQFGLKTLIFLVLLLLGTFLIVRRTGVMNSQKDRIEQALAKPVPVGDHLMVDPVWDEKGWTGDRFSVIAIDRKNHLLAWVQDGTGKGDGITRTVLCYHDIHQVALVVDGEAISSFSRPALAEAVSGKTMATGRAAVGKALDGVRKMPDIQPVADEESVRDIHLAVQASDGRRFLLSFGLQELDLARRWYRYLWQAVNGHVQDFNT